MDARSKMYLQDSLSQLQYFMKNLEVLAELKGVNNTPPTSTSLNSGL